MKDSKKFLAFISIDIACFLTILDSTIVNVSLPNMADYFNTTTTGISWVSTAYLIAFSALLINFSKIADIFGRKKLFIIGLFLFGIASVCCGLADTLPLLILFRIIQGVGAAILTPLPIPLGIEIYGKEALGKLSVIVGLTISVSAALGPVIGGVLNEIFTYRAIFYVNLPFIIISLIFGSLYLKESYDETISKKVDFVGSLLITVAIGSLTFLLVKGNSYGWTSSVIIILMITFLVSTIMFVFYEKTIKEPMIDFSLFKIKSFTSSILLIGIFFYAYMPISYLINFYFENTLKFSVLKAGLLMGIPSATAFLFSPLMPLFARFLSARVISFLSISLAVTGNLLLVCMTSQNYMKIICISFILMGVGVRITTVLYQTAYEEVSNDKNGIASGIQNSFRQVAACIAIALVSTLSAHFTTVATSNTEDYIVSEVNESEVLSDNIKTEFLNALDSTDSSSEYDADEIKEQIHSMLNSYEQLSLAQSEEEQSEIISESYAIWENELDNIIDDAQTKEINETYKVYNKCFLISGLVAMTGFIVVPFNVKNKNIYN